jgi:DNA repair protein RAD50
VLFVLNLISSAFFRGSSLINDPGMTDATEVKAHIKLRFQNRSNRVCVAVRSLQVTRKRTKLEYKALEGVLRTTDDNGENVSISMKCSDMDRLIPENLGVSPAILENVIFCHQEDSNWPMQEGMVLKKKFDDVFESTRYTKALDALLKTKKEFQAKSKDLKADLGEYGAHLITVQQTKKELEENNENQEVCTKVIQGISTELDEMDEKMEEYSQKLSKYKSSTMEVEKLANQITQQEQLIAEQKKSLEQLLTEDDQKLHQTLGNFENIMKQKSDELKKIKQQIDSLQNEIQEFREINNSLNMKKGQSITLQEQLTAVKEQQISLISSLKTKYSSNSSSALAASLPVFTNANPWTLAMSKECLNILNQEISSFTADYQRNVLQPAKDSFFAVEKQKNEISNNLSKIEIELKLKSEEILALNQENEMKRIEFNKLSLSRTTLQRCEMEYESANRNYEEFMESYNLKSNDYKKSMKDISDKIRDLQEQLQNDTQILQDLSHHRNEIVAMDGNMKQIESDISTIHLELSSVFSITNREYLSDFPQPKTIQELEATSQQFEKRTIDSNKALTLLREELSNQKSEFAANDALLVTNSQSLGLIGGKLKEYKIYEKEMKEVVVVLNQLRNHKILAESGFEMISSTTITIEELLMAVKLTEDEARELLVIAKSGKVFLKRLKKARQSNPNQCPCCGQGMNNTVQETYETRTKQLFSFFDEDSQGTLEEHKEILDKATELHDRISSLHQKILPLQHQQLEYEKIEKTLKELQSSKESKKNDLSAKEVELTQLELMNNALNKILRQLQDVSYRWKSLDVKKVELSDRRRRTSDITSHQNSNRSIEEIERTHHANLELKDNLQFQKDKITQDESNLQRKFYTMKSLLQEKEKALSDAKLDSNRVIEIENQLKVIENKLTDSETLKKKLMNNKRVIQQEYNDLLLQFNSTKADLENKEMEFNRSLSVINKDKENLQNYVVTFDELTKKMNDLSLNRITEKLQENNREILKLENMINRELDPLYQKTTTELTSQERVKRNILNNLELRERNRELEGLKVSLQEKEALYGIKNKNNLQDIKNIEREYQKTVQNKQVSLSERDQAKGQLEIFKKNAGDMNKKLNLPLYKGIEDKHRKKLIEMETTNLAVSDLDNYYNAL